MMNKCSRWKIRFPPNFLMYQFFCLWCSHFFVRRSARLAHASECIPMALWVFWIHYLLHWIRTEEKLISRSTYALSHCRAEIHSRLEGRGVWHWKCGHSPAGAPKSVGSIVFGIYFWLLLTCHCQSSRDCSSCPPPLHRASALPGILQRQKELGRNPARLDMSGYPEAKCSVCRCSVYSEVHKCIKLRTKWKEEITFNQMIKCKIR